MGAVGGVWGCQKEKMEERQSLGGTYIFWDAGGSPWFAGSMFVCVGWSRSPLKPDKLRGSV